MKHDTSMMNKHVHRNEYLLDIFIVNIFDMIAHKMNEFVQIK